LRGRVYNKIKIFPP